MKLRWVLLVTLAAFVAAGVWVYQLYFRQLNDSLALQRCVLQIEQEKRATGSLPSSMHCSDYWGGPVTYLVRDGTYLLVSAGSDGQVEANYGSVRLSDIAAASTCSSRGADTVFVGERPVRSCFK